MSKEHLLLNSELMRPIMNRSYTLQPCFCRNQLVDRSRFFQPMPNSSVLSSLVLGIPTPDTMPIK